MNRGRGFKTFLNGVIFLIVGLCILVPGCIAKLSSETTKNDFNYMASSEFAKGKYVNGEVCFVMDYFEEEETTRDGKSSITGRTYLIPVAFDEETEKYLGVFVPASKFDDFDEITTATFDYLFDETGEVEEMAAIPEIQISGKLKAYESDEMGYLYEYMEWYLGTTSQSECDNYIIPYFVDYKASGTSGVQILLGGIFTGIGLIILIVFAIAALGGRRKDDDVVSYNNSYGNDGYGNMNTPDTNNSTDNYTYNDNQYNNENTTFEDNEDSRFK